MSDMFQKVIKEKEHERLIRENNVYLEDLIRKTEEIERLKHNWNCLVCVLEKQIEDYKDSECEELQAMVQEDKSILFLMREYEDGNK